jgi:hypothetical protein
VVEVVVVDGCVLDVVVVGGSVVDVDVVDVVEVGGVDVDVVEVGGVDVDVVELVEVGGVDVEVVVDDPSPWITMSKALVAVLGPPGSPGVHGSDPVTTASQSGGDNPLLAATVRLKVPAVVGVPERSPLSLSVSPGGMVPETSEKVGAGKT